MVFSVKYRDSSGAVCEKAVEAANRADCFAKCKVQGIVPIGVDVSAATKKPAHASGFEASAKSKIVMLVVALMAVGAAVWLWPKGKPTSAPSASWKRSNLPKSGSKRTNPSAASASAQSHSLTSNCCCYVFVRPSVYYVICARDYKSLICRDN